MVGFGDRLVFFCFVFIGWMGVVIFDCVLFCGE